MAGLFLNLRIKNSYVKPLERKGYSASRKNTPLSYAGWPPRAHDRQCRPGSPCSSGTPTTVNKHPVRYLRRYSVSD